MKVNYPEERAIGNEIVCRHCPFTDEEGRVVSIAMGALCDNWNEAHDFTCPTLEGYAEACKLAEEVPSVV